MTDTTEHPTTASPAEDRFTATLSRFMVEEQRATVARAAEAVTDGILSLLAALTKRRRTR